MKFVWDENKNRLNIKNHDIAFDQVIPAFFDPLRKEYYDVKHSLDEDRYLLAGYALESVLLVSFAETEPDTFRIISARKAKKHEERRLYNDGR
ncbi:MAG: BrnT family toxin [Treponema sp.]|jgi:uncharacterized DUF497 family protein|nr:BrnT family toxin [Treponema sp.]